MSNVRRHNSLMRRIGLLLILLAIVSLVAPAFHRQLTVVALLQPLGLGGGTAALLLLTSGGSLWYFGARHPPHAPAKTSGTRAAVAIAVAVLAAILIVPGLQEVNSNAEREAQSLGAPWTGPTLFRPRYNEETKWPVVLKVSEAETAAVTLRGPANSGGFFFDVTLTSARFKGREAITSEDILQVLRPSLCRENGFIPYYGLETYSLVFSVSLQPDLPHIVNIPWGYCSRSAH